MKLFPNVLREFNEIDLPSPSTRGDRGVFVFLAVNGFEVLSQRE
jgi:hypothetical protein